jgi:hypothetical protein
MPAASAFTATYLDPTAGTLVSKNPSPWLRFTVANAVFDLVRLLNDGNSAANAQAEITRKVRHMRTLYKAAGLLGASTIITDFQAITTP